MLRRYVFVILGLAFLGGFWSVALDWDHIWMFILQVPDPVTLSQFAGRPFHTITGVIVQSVLFSIITVALILRWNDVK
jgi:hypothetical protein